MRCRCPAPDRGSPGTGPHGWRQIVLEIGSAENPLGYNSQRFVAEPEGFKQRIEPLSSHDGRPRGWPAWPLPSSSSVYGGALELVGLRPRPDDKEVEIPFLRHQLAVLYRQIAPTVPGCCACTYEGKGVWHG
jgi:hypothetical protein